MSRGLYWRKYTLQIFGGRPLKIRKLSPSSPRLWRGGLQASSRGNPSEPTSCWMVVPHKFGHRLNGYIGWSPANHSTTCLALLQRTRYLSYLSLLDIRNVPVFFVVVWSLNYVWLYDPMDCSMPGFSVLSYLWELAQIHVCWVSDALYPSHPLPPSSPFALNLSHHQSLFQRVSSLPQVAKVLEL